MTTGWLQLLGRGRIQLPRPEQSRSSAACISSAGPYPENSRIFGPVDEPLDKPGHVRRQRWSCDAEVDGEIGGARAEQRRVDADEQGRIEEDGGGERLRVEHVQWAPNSQSLHHGHDEPQTQQTDFSGQGVELSAKSSGLFVVQRVEPS